MGFRGLVAKVLIFASLFSFCGKDSPTAPSYDEPTPTKNKSPNTTLTFESFDNKGNVGYYVSGTDSDGSIKHISVKRNGTLIGTYANNSSVSIPIVQGNNSLEAIACDNKNALDTTPATDSFYSPSEEQAREKIEEILLQNNSAYDKVNRDVLLSFGEKDTCRVDYLVKRKDGKDAVINYVGHKDDLNQGLSNNELLDSWGISNLNLVRLPESKLRTKLNDFISGGFKK